jgi:hypothetical protein
LPIGCLAQARFVLATHQGRTTEDKSTQGIGCVGFREWPWLRQRYACRDRICRRWRSWRCRRWPRWCFNWRLGRRRGNLRPGCAGGKQRQSRKRNSA